MIRTALAGAAAATLLVGLACGAQAQSDPPAAPAQATPSTPPAGAPAAAPDPKLDAAFGAYQRGLYLTAFREATQRIAADPNDTAAMTLLGELYAVGLGVAQDWSRAAEWYRLASARGDPQAAFALGMMMLDGKEGIKADPAQARRLLETASEAVPAAAYHLGLILLGDNRAESDRRAAELFAGLPSVRAGRPVRARGALPRRAGRGAQPRGRGALDGDGPRRAATSRRRWNMP